MVTFLFSEKMSEIIKEGIKMENIEIKEESLEEIFPSSTVENTCSVDKDMLGKLENKMY